MMEFRAQARGTAADGARDAVESLLRRPAESGWNEDELELELEMLHGRLAVLDLEAILQAGSLPVVATQHKAVAHETCHFLAPVSVAGEAGASSAKLFVTSRRIRVLGARDVSVTWGTIRDVRVDARDLIVSSAGAVQHLLRCNSFADAWVAARLARALVERHRASSAGEPGPAPGAGHDPPLPSAHPQG